jgi:hypothetical protein
MTKQKHPILMQTKEKTTEETSLQEIAQLAVNHVL